MQHAFDFIPTQETQLDLGFKNLTPEQWHERLAEDREENERTYRRSN